MSVCVRVCADQQDGDSKGDSQHDLQVLLHVLDDPVGAGLQDDIDIVIIIINITIIITIIKPTHHADTNTSLTLE